MRKSEKLKSELKRRSEYHDTFNTCLISHQALVRIEYLERELEFQESKLKEINELIKHAR